MEPGEMLTYQPPSEHVGVTWLVIVSPLLLLLLFATVQHYIKNPPEWCVLVYNALLRTKRRELYIQALEAQTKRQAEVIKQMRENRYMQEPEEIPYEELSDLDKWRHDAKEALRPRYTQEERDEMRGIETPAETIVL